MRLINHSRPHAGRNIRRVRVIRGLSEATLAQRLGSGWEALDVSALEQLEDIDYELLQRIANALDVSMDLLITFGEVAVVHYLNTYFNDYELEFPGGRSIDPLDRVITLFEKRLLIEREKTVALGREREKLKLEVERMRRNVVRA